MVSLIIFIIGWRFWRPLGHDHALEGTRAIDLADKVFRLSESSGGMASHPWKTDGKVILEGDLVREIKRLNDRISDRKLRSSLKIISDAIKKIALNSVQHPYIWFEGMPGKSQAQMKIDNAKALRQQEAYISARSEIQKALTRVAKMEVRFIWKLN